MNELSDFGIRVHKAREGEWFFSVIDHEGLTNVGYWRTQEECIAAAKEHIQSPKAKP